MRDHADFSLKSSLWEVWCSLRWKEQACVLAWAAGLLVWLFGFTWAIYAVSN